MNDDVHAWLLPLLSLLRQRRGNRSSGSLSASCSSQQQQQPQRQPRNSSSISIIDRSSSNRNGIICTISSSIIDGIGSGSCSRNNECRPERRLARSRHAVCLWEGRLAGC